MYQIQHSPKLSASFPALHAKGKYNYNIRSTKRDLLDIPLTKTNMYEKNWKDWNNLKKDLSDIYYSELSSSKTKSYVKQKHFGQY